MTNTYTEPVSNLLTIGETGWHKWDDYSAFGFTAAHVPELILMGTDRYLLIESLNNDEDDNDSEIWAPVHAWRVLAGLQAIESIVPLVQVLDWGEETDSDFINECLTEALEKFGGLALGALEIFINESDHQLLGYMSVSTVIAKIGSQHPELRDRAVEIITSALDAHFERNDEEINGFWLADLLDLKAVESYPVIKKVFEAGKMDVYIAGDLEDVEIEFGMREERETPPPSPPLFFDRSRKPEGNVKPKRVKKEKNKNKQAKKSRKKNRKKK